MRTETYRRRRLQTGLPYRPNPRHPHIDPIAIERATHGDKVTLTQAERRAVVQQLTARGASARTIAQRLHIHPRTVQRHRHALSHDQEATT